MADYVWFKLDKNNIIILKVGINCDQQMIQSFASNSLGRGSHGPLAAVTDGWFRH